MYIASNGIKTAVILNDNDPMSPRDPDYQDNLSNMICWHRRYNLGDKHAYQNPNDFAEAMATKYVSDDAFFKAIQDGCFSLLRMKETDDGYAIQARNIYSRDSDNWEADSYEAYTLSDALKLPKNSDVSLVREDLMSYCSSSELLQLCNRSEQVAILPLYLYDHSGISMSTGSFVGRAPHAEWDSGQVGFIYMDKETAMENLAMASDELRIAKVFSEGQRKEIVFSRTPGEGVDDVLEKKGFSPVNYFHVKNLYDEALGSDGNRPLIDEDKLRNGFIFKRNHILYEFAGHDLGGDFKMRPLASFNPDLKRLSAENWKSRAKEVLEADVEEYDNYLRGDVYGFKLYEGLDEVDSCWGFNPGREDIRELMKAELGDWLAPGMDFKFSHDYGDYDIGNFDINDFYEDRDFPELREKIQNAVKDFIVFEDSTSRIYPFGMPADHLLVNVDYALDDIVESLYEDHLEPDSDRIFDAITDRVGVSREVQPKITAADLEPGREYTADELMEVINKKPSLKEMIQNASFRQSQAKPSHEPKERGQEH